MAPQLYSAPIILIIGRQGQCRSLVHLMAAVAEDTLNRQVQWEGKPVWTTWSGLWSEGKFAELFIAELVSITCGVYACEGGLNVNVGSLFID
jgi:hypothetical protein